MLPVVTSLNKGRATACRKHKIDVGNAFVLGSLCKPCCGNQCLPGGDSLTDDWSPLPHLYSGDYDGGVEDGYDAYDDDGNDDG